MKRKMKLLTLIVTLVSTSFFVFSQRLEGFENLNAHFENANGTFMGQDGSTWYYYQCNSNYSINDKSITLGSNTTYPSNFYSGQIPGGMGTLSFDFIQATISDVDIDIFVNDEFVANISSTNQIGVTQNTGNILVNVEGYVQIKISNVEVNSGEVVIDNISWTVFTNGDNHAPIISNVNQKPSSNQDFFNEVPAYTPITVTVDAIDIDGSISNFFIEYTFNSYQFFNTYSIGMTQTNGSKYQTTLPAVDCSEFVSYIIKAVDNNGAESVTPTYYYQGSAIVYDNSFSESLGDAIVYSVEGEYKVWEHKNIDNIVQMDNDGSTGIEEDWLILPNIYLQYDYIVFNAWRSTSLNNTDNYLKIYFSDEYTGTGDPSLSNWQEIEFTLSENEETWELYSIDIPYSFSGSSGYIAFKYRYQPENNAIWKLKGVSVWRDVRMVSFFINDGVNPIYEAEVEFDSKIRLSETDGTVVYPCVTPNNNYQYTVSKQGYYPVSGTVNVTSAVTLNVNLVDSRTATNVAASPDANTATITWEGQGADQYGILYTEEGSKTETYINVKTNPATIFVNPETTYSLRIRSQFDGKWSNYSDAIQFTSLPGVPLIAQDIVVNNITGSTAEVSWTGEGADSYGIYYYESNSSVSHYITSKSSPQTIIIKPQTSYGIKIRTIVDEQWSPYSQPVFFTSPEGEEVMASNVFVSDITSNSAVVSWEGTGADLYGIYYENISNQNSYYLSTTTSPITILVSPSSAYTLKIRTKIGGIWSSYTSPVQFTSLAGTPVVATNISVSNITASSAEVNWDGSGAETYGIYYYDINSTTWHYTSSTSSPMTINVSPETTYGLMIKSKVNGQWSPYSMPVQFTTPSGEQVLASNIIVNNITPISADVSWLGSGAEWYFVYFVETGTSNYFYKYSKSSPTTINLDPEKNYTLMVKTRVNGRWSSYTSPIAFSTPSLPKTAPVSFGMDESKQVVPENLMVYPNPAKEYTNIRFSLSDFTDVTLRVYSMSGVLVKSETLLNSFGEVDARLNLEGISNGVYILQISTPIHSKSQRLIIQ